MNYEKNKYDFDQLTSSTVNHINSKHKKFNPIIFLLPSLNNPFSPLYFVLLIKTFLFLFFPQIYQNLHTIHKNEQTTLVTNDNDIEKNSKKQDIFFEHLNHNFHISLIPQTKEFSQQTSYSVYTDDKNKQIDIIFNVPKNTLLTIESSKKLKDFVSSIKNSHTITNSDINFISSKFLN